MPNSYLSIIGREGAMTQQTNPALLEANKIRDPELRRAAMRAVRAEIRRIERETKAA
jgi:hypothetical protein